MSRKSERENFIEHLHLMPVGDEELFDTGDRILKQDFDDFTIDGDKGHFTSMQLAYALS